MACSSPDFIEVTRTSLNDHWNCDYGDSTVEVSIPHTPRIEPLVVYDQWQGKITYTKTLCIDQPAAGKTFIHFEGAMHEAIIFLNDVEVKRHVGGYLPFTVDASDHLRSGDNVLRVELLNTDNSKIPPGKALETLDFNYYGGIYRDVWLIRKNDIYITDPFVENTKEAGWLVHFEEVTEKIAQGSLRIHVKNESGKAELLTVKASLSFGEDSYDFISDLIVGLDTVVTLPLAIPNPDLWSIADPNLYAISIELTGKQGLVWDRVTDKIGIRSINLNADGFFLNGEKQFIRGTNRHQEYPYVGYAISNNANYRDALKIKNAGFDFVRLSHYPQDESFLDACDELGILVMNAIPGWQYFEEGEFVRNSYQDIRDMVRRDRNHPSVIFWEVSLNESGMTDAYMKEANRILKEELPFEDTYSAGWMDHPSYDLFIPARQHAKPPYYWNNYKDGSRKIFVAEYGDWEYYAHNAGFNQTAFEDLTDEERTSRQLRSDGEKRLLQQAMNFQEAANSNRKGKGIIGHANWLMFDYNRGYADDLEASGISDIFRIPKFAYYFYKSQRPPNEDVNHPLVEDGPMVKIASYWTASSSTDLKVFSNCEEVALYLNDSLIAVNRPVVDEFSDQLLHAPFQFNIDHFVSGQLKAIGIVEGQPVAKDSVMTPGQPTAIKMEIDTTGVLLNDEEDLFFVYASIVDTAGNFVPTATNEVLFVLEGEGTLIGENPVKAEAGIASILVKSKSRDVRIDAIMEKLQGVNEK